MTFTPAQLDRLVRRAGAAMRIPIVPGEWLPPTIWFPYASGVAYDEAQFEPIANIPYAFGSNKPAGGLWTSPAQIVDGQLLGSDFLTRADGEGCPYEGPVWRVQPAAGITALVIHTRANLMHVADRWPVTYASDPDDEKYWQRLARHMPRRVDFQQIAEHVQAIYLTNNGRKVNKFTDIGRRNEPMMYDWDVSTVLYLDKSAYTISGPVEIPAHAVREETREKARLARGRRILEAAKNAGMADNLPDFIVNMLTT